MRDNTDQQDSAGYSDMLTDLGFFVVSIAACCGLGAVVWMLLL